MYWQSEMGLKFLKVENPCCRLLVLFNEKLIIASLMSTIRTSIARTRTQTHCQPQMVSPPF